MPSHPRFSHRTNWEFSSNQLNIELEKKRSSAQKIFDLTESNPTRCGFRYPDQLLTVLSDPQNLTYSPDSKGLLQVREAIVRYHKQQGTEVHPESVIVTSSTSEGYTHVFRLLLNPGDKVLVARPSYPLFAYLIELCDAQYDFYSLIYTNDRWCVDVDSLEAAVDPSVRAVIVVNPNNPTGSYISKEELEAVNRVCRRHHLALIADEVFFDYRLDASDQSPESLANNADVLTFTLNGISKSLGLPQMKLSWITTSGPNDAVQEAIKRLEMIADTFLSVNTPVQHAFPVWLGMRMDIQNEILKRLRTNHELIKAFTKSHGLEFFISRGGWYAVIASLQFHQEEQWVLHALVRQNVLVHPGYFFDFPSDGFLILSLLTPTEDLTGGLHALSSLIKVGL